LTIQKLKAAMKVNTVNLGELHQRQSDAWHSPATEVLYGGAAGGGKSHLMRVLATVYCLKIPNLQVYLFRRTYPDLWANHMEGPSGFPVLLAPLMESAGVTINYSKNEIRFGNGAKIHLSHCQHEKDVTNYQGAEIHILLIDELTHFTEKMYRFLRGRVRLAGLEVPEEHKGKLPMVFAASNPGGVGHNWVKASFIDPQPPLRVWRTPKNEGGFLRQYVPALLEDNPTLMESDPDYESRLEGLGSPDLVRAMRKGDWNIVSGGALDDLWDPAIHVIPGFDIPPTWRVDRSFDWGSSKPFSVGWWARSDGLPVAARDDTPRLFDQLVFPAGTLIRIHELYGWSGRADEGCRAPSSEIARRILEQERTAAVLEGLHVLPGPADTNIYQENDGKSIADKMAKAGVRWVPAIKGPGSRKTGLELLRERLKAGLARPMEEPGLFVFEGCRHFIRTVPVLPRSESDPEDVETKAEDHVYDEVRYRLLAMERQEGFLGESGEGVEALFDEG
jgi:hypothetical protein